MNSIIKISNRGDWKNKINTSRSYGEITMNIDQAMKIIVKPYITEKTFAMIENESKICFIVERTANKGDISEAVKIREK